MEFDEAIAKNFNKIKKDFIRKSINIFENFDEDIFMDSYLKCASALKNKQLTENEYIKYYWAAYCNSYKTDKVESSKFVSLDDPDKGQVISLYTPYNINIDITCNDIIEGVRKKFGDYYTNAWLMHIDGKSYKELESIGYTFKFNDIFKKIVKWVRVEFKKSRYWR